MLMDILGFTLTTALLLIVVLATCIVAMLQTSAALWLFHRLSRTGATYRTWVYLVAVLVSPLIWAAVAILLVLYLFNLILEALNEEAVTFGRRS